MPEPVPGIGFAPCDRRNKPIWQDENIRLIPVIPAELPLVSSSTDIRHHGGYWLQSFFCTPGGVEKGRQKVARRPLSPQWRAILEQRVAPYGQLTADQRQRLHEQMQVLLAEKAVPGLQQNWP